MKRIVSAGLFVGLFAPLSAQALDYEIWAELRTQGTDISGVDRHVGPVAATSLSDRDERTGIYAGNRAEARWSADLALGTLSGFAYGENAFADPVLRWRSANGDAQVSMQDTLTLRVPAGSYPSGARIGLSGAFNGSLYSSGMDPFADALVRWKLSLEEVGGYGYGESKGSRQVSNGETLDVAEPLSVSFQLLPPGSTLENPMSVKARVRAELVVAADTYGLGLANQKLVERADFENTLQILSVDVPPGTTWTSASGVFLPEASSAAQAAAALLVLAALRRRAR
jgi:hypothetical protein